MHEDVILWTIQSQNYTKKYMHASHGGNPNTCFKPTD